MVYTKSKDLKWGLLISPWDFGKLDQNHVHVKPTSVSLLNYTLDSLDILTRDYEIRQKIKEKWSEALAKNPRLKPGLKYKFVSDPKPILSSPAVGRIRERYGKPDPIEGLTLDLGITDYGVFVATNSAAKEDHEFAEYLMGKGMEFYNDEFAYFASPIGNCAIVESSDGKIALIKRAEDVHEYPGFYDMPGGHANPLKHSFDAKGQFDAIKDEVSEEIRIPRESIEESYLIGISQNKENFRKPDLSFYLRTGLHSSKMDPNEEVSRLEKLTKDELFEHYRKGTYKLVPPAEALLVSYFSLQGYDLSFLER